MIEAYLIKLDRAAPQTLAMLEFHDPGEETAAYLLTLGQLRRFGEAANSLLETANVS